MQRRGSLSQSEIVTFLEGATIPVRLGCRTPEDNLWMCSLWFRLVDADGDPIGAESATDREDWTLQCATSAQADIVSFLEHDSGVSFEVSTNDPPYAGVRGRGSVSIDPDPEKETLRALLERYLEDTESGLAQSLLDDGRDEVTITVDPAVVYGWDFSDRMRDTQ
ncbi:pyridoxamine 5'-phosphate oxidase family protein [Natronorubrum sp. JWXQ-INN-674]|uniref:Pyridoxamine 5'-phosphate oxidase family protein n=1 Tax=Natronorubrum halalkaliphilum TaxID=2691917 RepID=A0A6B0VSU5_9EURY|nr:pyridoxamine 5'-phosphate oxidase family protein [Natronorubrum halalkaliphilum]MXV64137.1 pyridoxamine 5'-phosphate oxidase family protein [Natronorubrum halalkaliphilum]